MDELKRLTDTFAAMSEAQRKETLRAIDGAPRQQKQENEQTGEYRPLPSARRMGVSVRVTTRVV